MNRRQFIIAAAAMVSLRMQAATDTENIIPLWRGTPPGGGGPGGSPTLSDRGALSHIATPLLQVFRPANPNGRAVLIAAGGGYKRIEMKSEAWPAAQWLAARGYSAYVLHYRLPGEGWHDGNRVALQDAQRALRLLCARERRVSVLGFSAGGHLLGMAVTRVGFDAYPPQDERDSIPVRVDGAALIYPVITLERPYSHTSTHKMLVGPHATAQEEARWSVQNYVTPQSPPFFLVQARDDPVSDPHNTLIMAEACERQHVPVELHRFSSGGHGFGMGKPGTPTEQWPMYYQDWLQDHA